MQKVMLTISPCKEHAGNVSVDKSKKFDVMLNPSNFTHTHSVSINQQKTLGQLASESKFSAYSPETVKFDIVLDGTGVIEGSDSNKAEVSKQVKNLKDIVYEYDGKTHEPNIVRLLWGSFSFYGRLSSLGLEYNLFKPSGTPLRAKVSLSFIGYMSTVEQAHRANQSSPDLSHHVEVKAGDTLPLLCYKIYNDCAYYLEVAKCNNITNISKLKPGTRLHFPPLR